MDLTKWLRERGAKAGDLVSFGEDGFWVVGIISAGAFSLHDPDTTDTEISTKHDWQQPEGLYRPNITWATLTRLDPPTPAAALDAEKAIKEMGLKDQGFVHDTIHAIANMLNPVVADLTARIAKLEGR